MWANNSPNASSPPAEAPMPTMGKMLSRTLMRAGAAGARVDVLRAAGFFARSGFTGFSGGDPDFTRADFFFGGMGEALATFVVAGGTFVLLTMVQVAEFDIEFHEGDHSRKVSGQFLAKRIE
jgi:hypothetical protein